MNQEKYIIFTDEDIIIQPQPELYFSTFKAARETKEILNIVLKTHFKAYKRPNYQTIQKPAEAREIKGITT